MGWDSNRRGGATFKFDQRVIEVLRYISEHHKHTTHNPRPSEIYRHFHPNAPASLSCDNYYFVQRVLRRLEYFGCIKLDNNRQRSDFQWTYTLNEKVVEEYLGKPIDPVRATLAAIIYYVSWARSFPPVRYLTKTTGYLRTAIYQNIATLANKGLLERNARIVQGLPRYEYDLDKITPDLLEKYDGMGSGHDDAETGAMGG